MKFRRNLRLFTGQLSVAPYVGVAFLLLIFLTLNSILVQTPGVRIELPPTPEEATGPKYPPLTIALDKSGQLFFEQQAISAASLAPKLKARVQQARVPLSLVVQADAGTPYATLMPIHRLAQEAGFKELLWATRPNTSPTPVPAPNQPRSSAKPGS